MLGSFFVSLMFLILCVIMWEYMYECTVLEVVSRVYRIFGIEIVVNCELEDVGDGNRISVFFKG